ncbi:MAG: hypothetical protein ACRDI1_03060, partial [Actinomycetota bacterium]
ITFHLDGTGGTELSATVAGVATPAAVPTGGSAAVTISLPGGTSEGPHTIHAVGLGGDSASYPITVDSTAPPVPSITSAPLSPTSLTDATLQFNDTEPGVTFYCQFDSGGFTPCTSPVSYSSLSEGPHSFQVRAHDAAGNQSFLATANWTVDTTLPTAAISFPLTGGIHNGASYNAGCGTASTGDICGSASDTGTGVTSVQVSIRQGSGNYHDGTGFSSPSETWLPTTGTTPWTHAFAATAFSTDGSYTVRARSSDAAGNISMIATESFTIDLTGPAASDIQINNGGATPGAPELGDTVVFTFSEPMTPASILSGWNGGSTTVIVRLDNSGASDTMAVYDSTNSTPLNLGTVGLLGNYVTGNLTFGLAGTASTMTVTGSTLTITLGTASGTARTVSAAATAQWTPSATATDVAGNAMSTSVGTEQGTADPNF